MNTRNRLLLRSVGFGGLTKIVGSLVVFVGLPVIGHALSASDYAIFLKSMSAAGFATLFLGAVVSVAVRSLVDALASGRAADIRAAENSSAGLFILSVAAAVVVSLPLILTSSTASMGEVFLAVGLAALTGMLMWGDSYRVALRTDHYSSLWQLGANSTMLLLLILLSRYGLTSVTLIYFGMPLVAQMAILVHLYRERPYRIRPSFETIKLRRQLAEITPLMANSLAEYGKVYGSGLVLSIVVGPGEYARFATIVLLVARLSNPLSLITRPLMPAYIDALHNHDARWLASAERGLVLLAALGAAAATLGSLLIDPAWLRWLIPSGLGSLGRTELFLAAMLLWGIGLTSLVTPIFIAGSRFVLFAAINAGMVIAGILAGLGLTILGHRPVMLATMAAGSALTAVVAMVAAHSLFRLPPPKQQQLAKAGGDA